MSERLPEGFDYTVPLEHQPVHQAWHALPDSHLRIDRGPGPETLSMHEQNVEIGMENTSNGNSN